MASKMDFTVVRNICPFIKNTCPKILEIVTKYKQINHTYGQPYTMFIGSKA